MPDPSDMSDKSTRDAPTLVSPQPTGRRLVQFHRDVPMARAAQLLTEAGGQAVAADSAGRMVATDGSIEMVGRFGLAAIGGGVQHASVLARSLGALDEVMDTRPEFWMFRIATPPPAGPPWADSAATTWGLEAVRAATSAFDGTGIKVCVLDTGLDLGHPDWVGRAIVTQSFVANESVDDVQGHGTHTAGTIAGLLAAPGGNLPRYGVTLGVDLHVGKVLNNAGSGRELDIVAGIEWGIEQGCAVISMSLGRAVAVDEEPDPIYEEIGARALEAGSLIVAAAGNESDRRYNYVAPVGAPANSPSIMAVAAIGADGLVAGFSSGGTGKAQVDLSGPGVQVFSSVPRPQLYAKFAGTSMACPHVAAVAALWAQSDPALRGQALWDKLVGTVLPLTGTARDIGAGLVQAP